jgi:hypothetical protein
MARALDAEAPKAPQIRSCLNAPQPPKEVYCSIYSGLLHPRPNVALCNMTLKGFDGSCVPCGETPITIKETPVARPMALKGTQRFSSRVDPQTVIDSPYVAELGSELS